MKDYNATEAPPGLDTVKVAGTKAGYATDRVLPGITRAAAGCKAVRTTVDHDAAEVAPGHGTVVIVVYAARYEAAVKVAGATSAHRCPNSNGH